GPVEDRVGAAVDRRVDPRAPAAGGGGEGHAPPGCTGEAVAGQVGPGLAAVGRLVDPAPRSDVGGEVGEPGVVADLPGGGEDRGGRAGIGGEVDGAGVVVHEQHLLPALAAVGAAEDATLRIGAEDVPLDGGEHYVGVAGIDPQAADVAAGGEPPRLPGLAAVSGTEDAGARGDVPAAGDLAGADVEHLGVARRHGERADR